MSTSATPPEDSATDVDTERRRADEPDDLAENDPLRAYRTLQGHWKWLARAIGVAFALYYLVRSGWIGPGSPQLHRGVFVGASAVLIFLIYPASQKRLSARQQDSSLDIAKTNKVPFYDLILAGLAAMVCWYFASQLPAMASRSGAPSDTDALMGIIAVAIVLEVTRRTVGWFLPIMGLIAIAYVFLGPYAPGMFRHGGYTFTRFTGIMFTSFNGIFGIVASIFANFVFLFIIFGTVLSKSGAARFFVDLPYALAGTMRGGPAKVALLVSAIMGSINGSAVANVMTTGTFTIPLMKKVGYRKEFAGGVEAAASTGGGILPPIMGAGAFILAEFTGIPYSTVVLYSIIPALMYFAGVYFLVDFEALKDDLAGIPRSELPNPWVILKEGWYYFLPLVTVFTLIIMNYSPAFAGFWGTVAAGAVGLIPYHGERMKPYNFLQVLWQSSFAALPIAGVVGTLGIVIGVMNLSGLGLKFSAIVVNAAGGSLLAALVLVTLASWILGAGLTVTTSYVIVAILAAPALTELGVSLLAAHLIILWVSQDANVTPPICVAAFAAASIAGGSLMRTGWEAWKLARGLYIIPFLMAYTGLVDGPITEIAHIALTGTLGIYFFCASVAGYMVRRAYVIERLILMGAAILLIGPRWSTNFIGIALGFGVYFFQKAQQRRRRKRDAEHVGAEGADDGESSTASVTDSSTEES